MSAKSAKAAAAAAAKMPQQILCPPQGSPVELTVWDSMQHPPNNEPMLTIHESRHQRRSSSAPSGGSRDCQRGADKFCHTNQPTNHNYLGLQPHQKQQRRNAYTTDSSQWPTLQRCSNCCGKGVISDNGPQEEEDSYHMNNSSGIGMNYGDWQRQQQQKLQQQQFQQQRQQQQQQQMQQQNMRSMRYNEFDDFQPALNSTMMDPNYQGNAGHHMQRTAYCPSSQQQQQQQQQPQMPQQLQQQAPQCRTQYGQPQQQASRACCMPQQQPSASYSNQLQRMQYPDVPCQMQHDLSNSYNETSYLQLPPRAQQQQLQQQQQSTTVTFRDQPSQGSSGYRSGTTYQPNQSMNQSSKYQNPSELEQSVPIINNLGSKKTPSCQDSTAETKSIKSLTPLSQMKHEDLIIHRAQTLFFESLVLDSNCPGVIQNSLSGKDNFNEHAFQIAFGDKIPIEPKPIDPITMLEAIKLRIDHERAEIHKKCPVERGESDQNVRQRKHRETRHEEHSKRSARSDTEAYYYKDRETKKKRRSHHETTTEQDLLSEDIDRHFRCKDNTDVNDAIHAYLKSENDYSTAAGHASRNFSANVNSHESNFLGLPIRMRIYNASTWPIE